MLIRTTSRYTTILCASGVKCKASIDQLGCNAAQGWIGSHAIESFRE